MLDRRKKESIYCFPELEIGFGLLKFKKNNS
jgi:hypothetical protein